MIDSKNGTSTNTDVTCRHFVKKKLFSNNVLQIPCKSDLSDTDPLKKYAHCCVIRFMFFSSFQFQANPL